MTFAILKWSKGQFILTKDIISGDMTEMVWFYQRQGVVKIRFLPPAYVVRGKVIFILGNVCLFTFEGGVPRSRWVGGPRSRWGGPRSRLRWGGYPVSDPGGYPVSGLGGGYLVLVKGKIFDTRFGLIHVQNGKKFFVKGPSPPPSKWKNF